jgi:ABC-type transport system involved in cytochrome c biogenesis permease subunit
MRAVLAPLASLRITVVLFALAIVLIFAGTWAQIDHGIWEVQHRYFHSLFCWIDFKLFLPRTPPDYASMSPLAAGMLRPMLGFLSHFGFPMLGGYLLGLAILINLLAAHAIRFKFTWKRSGILLIHFGLILLIAGEALTSVFATEGQMVIEEGQASSFTQDIRTNELAVIDTSPADHDNVVAIGASRLVHKGIITHPNLPFSIRVDEYFPNSQVLGPFQAGAKKDVRATAGIGAQRQMTVEARRQVTGAEAQTVDTPSAYVTLLKNGQSLGTYLVSIFLGEPQAVSVDGREYLLDLRFARDYKPFTITLHKFSFDRYTGTNVAKNYSSRVHLSDPSHHEDRDLTIWMNHPLRYAGYTFFQADFNHDTEKGTVLQVVSNPSWTLPYVACILGGLGLVIHFGMHLLAFLGRQLGSIPAAQPVALYVPATVVGLALLYVIAHAMPKLPTEPYNLRSFAELPISYEGRVMPLDTLARTHLKVISGRQSTTLNGETMPAVGWLLNVMCQREEVVNLPVFRIDEPGVIGALGLDHMRHSFSLKEIFNNGEEFKRQVEAAMNVPSKSRNLFQRRMVELYEHADLFTRLEDMSGLYLAPPSRAGEAWKTVEQALQEAKSGQAGGELNPALQEFGGVVDAFSKNDAADFNATLTALHGRLNRQMPGTMDRVSFEAFFNRFDPFTIAMTFYIAVFLLSAVHWLFHSRVLTLSAVVLLLLALAVHAFGLVARIYISGRPPVTNLYSSAIFIAFAGVVFATALEIIYRNGIGSAVAGFIGFVPLLIAEALANTGNGDTMQQLQAVLDTNFWLATHVVVITLGYAATFLAGLIAIVYLLMGVFTRALNSETAKTLGRMVYGILCFAMLFSFVGTVLGGIWADQSWGRFWGWDPKENGAVLIVLWNALILHARWGGVVRQRGVMLLAVFGNIVTAWSWFGTNMLGVGLHSYGFMDSALFWLAAFIVSQLSIIAVGNLPMRLWRSSVVVAAKLPVTKLRDLAPSAG